MDASPPLRLWLLAVTAATLCWSPAAEASSGCAFRSATLTITGYDDLTLERGGIPGNPRPDDPVLVGGAPCSPATVSTTDRIVVSHSDVVAIDLARGALAPGLTDEPGDSDEVEIEVSSDVRTVIVRGGAGDDDFVDAGQQVSLNGDDGPETDVAWDGRIVWRGEGGDDVLRARTASAASDDAVDLSGNAGDDTLVGGTGDDELDGGEGDDDLHGGDGDDRLAGGQGHDVHEGGGGLDIAVGDRFAGTTDADLSAGTIRNDGEPAEPLEHVEGIRVHTGGTLVGSPGDDVFQALNGVVRPGAGDDRITCDQCTVDYADVPAGVVMSADQHVEDDGYGDTDVIVAAGLPANVDGSEHDDVLYGGAVRGAQGDDELHGGALSGGEGDDRLVSEGTGRVELRGGPGADAIVGGDSAEDVVLPPHEPTRGLVVDLTAGVVADDGTGSADTVSKIDTVVGTDFDDDLRGGPAATRLEPQGGDDELRGGPGDDTFRASAGRDSYDGGPGRDTLDAWSPPSVGPLSVDLAAGTVEQDAYRGSDASIAGVEDVVGTADADHITGDAGPNRIEGGGGPDDVEGGPGDDVVWIGAGIVRPGGGSDKVTATPWTGLGEGATVTYDDAVGPVTIGCDRDDEGPWWQTPAWVDETGGTTDVILGATVVVASPFADHLAGGEGCPLLDGAAGPDRLDGTPAAERVLGGPGDDVLLGGGGDDGLGGGAGVDTIDGGPGARDQLMFSDAPAGVDVDLAASTVRDDGYGNAEVVAGIEGAGGSAHPDRLAGDDGANVLSASGGEDVLTGRGGDDYLYTRDDGDDAISCGDGDDYAIVDAEPNDATGEDCEAVDRPAREAQPGSGSEGDGGGDDPRGSGSEDAGGEDPGGSDPEGAAGDGGPDLAPTGGARPAGTGSGRGAGGPPRDARSRALPRVLLARAAGGALRVRASEAGTLLVAVERRAGRRWRRVAGLTRDVRAGVTTRVAVPRSRLPRRGRLRLVVVLVASDGRWSRPRALPLRS